MEFPNNSRRSSSATRQKSKPFSMRNRHAAFEPLEERQLLSVTLTGVPDWVAKVPAPIVAGNSDNVTGQTPATSLEMRRERSGSRNDKHQASLCGHREWRHLANQRLHRGEHDLDHQHGSHAVAGDQRYRLQPH